MYAVGRLSNYISQGVYSVAAPFHPFGGAVDIIVVQQEDGTFKCSPWYVKFGKFQGVLKRREKIVTVAVNGEEAGFHMYLDHKGEAYFLKEVESDDEETSIFSPPSAPSSGDEGAVDRRPSGRRISFKEEDLKGEEKPEGDAVAEESSNSPPSDGIVIRKNKEGTLIAFSEQSPSVEEEQSGNQLLDNSECNSSSTKNGVKNGKILSKSPSKRKSILSYVFRSRSKRFSESHVTASDTDQKDGQGEMSDGDGRSSVDRAEIVADLLDSKWATGNGANKEETAGEKVVEINSFSSSFGDDAPSPNLVSELIEEKTNSDEVSPLAQDEVSEDSIAKQEEVFEQIDSQKREESIEEDPIQVLYNHNGESTVENCVKIEYSVQHGDDAKSETSITKQDCAQHDDLERQKDSTEGDSVQILYNHDGQSMVENCAENSVQHRDSETCPSHTETVLSVEGNLNNLNNFGRQTSVNDADQHSENSIPNQIDMNPLVLVELYEGSRNFNKTFQNNFQERINKIQQATNNSHLPFAKCSSDGQEQMKHKEKQEEEMRQLTSMQELAESPCDCTTSISLSDVPRGCSHLSVSLLVPLDDPDPCTGTDEGTKTVHQAVDSTHLQFAKCSSDEQEQMEHKEKQEEDLQQVTSVVELGGSSCDMRGSLLLSSDDLGPYSEREEGIKTVQQAPDIEVESTTKGVDETDKTKGNTISDVEAVLHVTHQKEPSRSFCDCDAPRENRTDQKLLLEEASDTVRSLLDHVDDSDPRTESTEEMQSLQQVQDIAVGPLTDSQNYEIEQKDFSAKEEDEALVNFMPPKELDESSFCDFDAPRGKRSDQILVPEEAFKYTNAQEDMEVTMTCNNLINSKLDSSHRTNFQAQHDLGASESVFRQYEVRKLEFFVSNNKFVKSDQLHVQMEETYSNQTMNESTDDLELTFNDEYVLNDCLALSDLEPPIQEGTREHELSFCTRQEEQAGRLSGDGNLNEEHSFPDQQHDEQHKLSSLSLNITNIINDSNMKYSNGNVSHLSGTETIPININIRGMHIEGKVDAMQALRSLPDFGNHFSDLENADAGHVFSRSLDFDSACLKRGINGENHYSNSQNVVRSCEKEAAQEWTARADSSESSQKQHKTDTGNVRVQPFNSIDISLCRHLLVEGMGAAAAAQAFDSLRVSSEEFLESQTGITKNENLVVRMGGQYFPWDAAEPIILGMAVFGLEGPAEPEGAIPVERVEKTLEKYASDSFVTPSNGWKLWLPFSFRRSKTPERSKSAQIMSRNDLIGSESEASLQDSFDGSFSDYYRKASKREVRSNTPTSEQLASLKLKEGQNLITFTFSTRVLGKQQVDARIYLWKWNTRIVISDVDGTITKSDVLGQFMPLVGKDWTQSGVAHLFSAIKDNGYQLLFLSARAIAQAYLTRQFLLNIKQDGKALPDGPIVISPDGLFPSLYREVIRRAPHEFKIACLEDIRKLFPPDCNPFYAGFGNRNTDEISYLKVGIPKGKIFIINPKGEVAVNHRVDMKSYTSLHSLVNGMFPAMSSSEQEDFNSWNYWRMPLPDIDV